MDEIIEATTQGWGSRLLGSIKSVGVGLVLFLIAFPLLWWNEGRAVQTYLSLNEGAGAVVEVPADSVDPVNEGRLIHISGTAETDETLTDATFNVSSRAIALNRTVEMYAWVEDVETETRKKVGGKKETIETYSYHQDWVEYPEESSSFRDSAGHENPDSMKYSSQEWYASEVTVGAFQLSSNLAFEIRGDEPIEVTDAMFKEMPPEVTGIAAAAPVEEATPVKKKRKRRGKKARRGKRKRGAKAAKVAKAAPPPPTVQAQVHGGGIFFGSDPANPAVGDLRVTFKHTLPREVSVIAQQRGEHLAGYQTEAGDVLEMLTPGLKPAATMFEAAQASNTMFTWILRLVGFLMMFFGVNMLFSPFRVFADVIPFLGSMVGIGFGIIGFVIAAPLTLLTIAIAWLFYRPLLAIGLIAVGVAAVVGIKVLAGRRAPQQAEMPEPVSAEA